MRRLPFLIALGLGSLVAALPVLGQTPSAPPAADAAFAAQKAAFLAQPLATRKGVQDALVWLGLYNGTSDGDFGKRTRDSIVAFQMSQKSAGDGALSPGQLQALLAAGQKARAAVGFQTIADPKTGARIGAPTKLMGDKNGPRLDFASSADPDLGALYARLSAETPTRKVAYKAIKPDAFFVVSGQEGTRKFYSRFEKNGPARPPIRGFTFAYPASAQNFDRIALAVANSFEAFPAAGETAASAAGAPEAPASPAPLPPALPPAPAATALIVAPGEALTALKPESCPNPTVGGKPARFERIDAATGLALLAGDFGGRAEPPRVGALSSDLVVLSVAVERVAANAARLASDAPPSAVASLEKSASGAPAFDRSGGLVGLVAPIAEEPKRVAGVALAAPHALIEPQAIGAFLGGGELQPERSSPPLSAGAIAARQKGTVLAVFCVP
ncbi:MAG TPA: peptidoglycan-binding domain-containing protein [Roseiarcus sp.]|nr:peptidoglycan-binding domain-containing protein [Roseiarcus sp.]